MRPLGHLGVGVNSRDYHFMMMDQGTYDLLYHDSEEKFEKPVIE